MKFILCIALLALSLISCSKNKPAENGPTLVQSIQIAGANITNGAPAQLSAIVLPNDASNKEVTWSVVPTSVATISATGLLTPIANGSVTVKAVAKDNSGITAEKVFTVSGVVIPPAGTVVTTKDELIAAISKAKAGDRILVKAGTYNMTAKITITQSGTAADSIYLLPYPGEATRPKLDFSAMAENSANQGIVLMGNYWNIKGIDIYKAGDNGLQIRGSNNIIENCSFSECSDTGLQIDNGAANNLILNCDSFFNADSTIENADGFACKLNAGSGNRFVGCRAWQNLDDGWDGYLRGTDNITTTYENCWAYKNGYLKNGSVSGGDGNGFKTGGSDDKLLKHNGIYKNCIAAGNLVQGFNHNSNRGAVTLFNCVAHGNGTNMGFGSTNPIGSLTIKNCAVPGTVGSLIGTVTDITNNSWQNGLICNSADYESIDMTQLIAPRKADGSLPDITYLHLVNGSDLINKGVNVGLPFNSTAPDLGCFESNF